MSNVQLNSDDSCFLANMQRHLFPKCACMNASHAMQEHLNSVHTLVVRLLCVFAESSFCASISRVYSYHDEVHENISQSMFQDVPHFTLSPAQAVELKLRERCCSLGLDPAACHL